MVIVEWRYRIVKGLWKTSENIRKHPYLHPLNCFANLLIKRFSKNIFAEGVYTKKLLQLFDQSIYLKVVSFINPLFPLWFKTFKMVFENFALVNISKLVISKPNISKTDISYLLKRTLMCIFQEVRNVIFKVDWFTFIKTKFIGVVWKLWTILGTLVFRWNRYVIDVACRQCKCLKSRELCHC